MSLGVPAWAAELKLHYESGASSQFILHGNVRDRFAVPSGGGVEFGDLLFFLKRTLLSGFDVILSYDLGNGIRVEKGGEAVAQSPALDGRQEWPKAPRQAAEALTRFFRYAANLSRLGQGTLRVACLVQGAEMVAPASYPNQDASAVAMLLREWGSDDLLTGHPLATFLIADTLADLHPILARNPRSFGVKVPLPDAAQLALALGKLGGQCPDALDAFAGRHEMLASQLVGSAVSSVESLVRIRQHTRQPLSPEDIGRQRKELVERDCGDLVSFVDSKRTLDDVHGQPALKTWLRQDLALWRAGDTRSIPMGYLVCGPVGTGKTYLVECLAGEAGVPVVKLKNFRDKWVGSTEANLERIFRLISALGRCFVFIDEADQALGRRDSRADDGGLSGRIYSLFAQEMSNTANRGKVVWILATSRPDLVEVDLKRPGRVDVKIPIFPTATAAESFSLLSALANRLEIKLDPGLLDRFGDKVPLLLTPGAAEVLATKIYRLTRADGLSVGEAFGRCLENYQPPVPAEIIERQIGLAVAESTDISFVPESFRKRRPAKPADIE